MYTLYIDTANRCSGIIFNTRVVVGSKQGARCCLTPQRSFIARVLFLIPENRGGNHAPYNDVADHCTGMIFNTREKGEEHYHHLSGLFHSMGIISNTRE